VKRTFTSKLSNMRGVPKQKEPDFKVRLFFALSARVLMAFVTEGRAWLRNFDTSRAA
jgi:hypothetical protein